MKLIGEHGGVLLAGVVTSLATAVVVTIVHNVTGFNLFGFYVFLILPAGATCCGLAAASGYYYSAKYLHMQPSKYLLWQMVVVAAFTQLLIYWLEYKTLVVDGVGASALVTFADYIRISLTTAHMRLGRAAEIDAGQVGSFGYWICVIDFVGFLVGGVALYFNLKAEPTCQVCQKYLGVLTKKIYSFADPDEFAAYYDNEFANPVGSDAFARHVGTVHSAEKEEKGTINLQTRVLGCPACGLQAVDEKVTVFNGRDWKDVRELNRFIPMPGDVDVVPLYKGEQWAMS